MRERERLIDFRGGHVACRGCKRLILFTPGELVRVHCCGYLYVPEYGPMDLAIYDRLAPGEDADAQVMPPPPPLVVLPNEEETLWYGGEPAPAPPDPAPDEGEDDEEPGEGEDAEVAAMLATPQEIQERRAERQQQLKRRGPQYD
jgi:hypothetical protein